MEIPLFKNVKVYMFTLSLYWLLSIIVLGTGNPLPFVAFIQSFCYTKYNNKNNINKDDADGNHTNNNNSQQKEE